jgi:predicted nucleic acid-binding protein
MTNPLFVDANILVRFTVGRAAELGDDLKARGAQLATTDAQAREAQHILHHVFGLSEEQAAIEMHDTLAGMQLYHAPTYRNQEASARARIHYKNTRDWPILAAAIGHHAAIWTDDRDFFGTGVTTWTTRNVKFWERSEF